MGGFECAHGPHMHEEIRNRTELTTAPVKATTAPPEFVDNKGIRRVFGISRTHAYVLLSEGKIRGVSLRKPGGVRGKRLYDAASVRDYLNSCAA